MKDTSLLTWVGAAVVVHAEVRLYDRLFAKKVSLLSLESW